jgi:hypothetical protein
MALTAYCCGKVNTKSEPSGRSLIQAMHGQNHFEEH